MSQFDHDAAGRRGVDRQEFLRRIERLLNEKVDAQTEAHAGKATQEQYLAEMHIALLTLLLAEDHEPRAAFFRQVGEGVREAAGRAADEIERFARDEAESRMMLLTLAQTFLGYATQSIPAEFSRWESKTFRERERPVEPITSTFPQS